MLFFEWVDVSYEYLINEESSFGTALAFNLGDVTDVRYTLTPFYRRYFSDKFARGYYVEGFGMLFSAKNNSDYAGSPNNIVTTETGFGLGFSFGRKFVSKKGFSAESFFGFGRNLLGSKNDYNEFVGRIRISLGYRF